MSTKPIANQLAAFHIGIFGIVFMRFGRSKEFGSFGLLAVNAAAYC